MPQNFLASVKERCERNIFLIRQLLDNIRLGLGLGLGSGLGLGLG
jgi:hypothetical protein